MSMCMDITARGSASYCLIVDWRTLSLADLCSNAWLQVVFAAIAPGKVVANLVAGAVAEAGAQQAGDMMQVNTSPACCVASFLPSTAP